LSENREADAAKKKEEEEKKWLACRSQADARADEQTR